MLGHPTPKGVFTIIGRERYHRSNIYSDAPMPFMQRITWSGIAMHLGVVPGHPASHGCIRLPAGFAANFGIDQDRRARRHLAARSYADRIHASTAARAKDAGCGGSLQSAPDAPQALLATPSRL